MMGDINQLQHAEGNSQGPKNTLVSSLQKRLSGVLGKTQVTPTITFDEDNQKNITEILSVVEKTVGAKNSASAHLAVMGKDSKGVHQLFDIPDIGKIKKYTDGYRLADIAIPDPDNSTTYNISFFSPNFPDRKTGGTKLPYKIYAKVDQAGRKMICRGDTTHATFDNHITLREDHVVYLLHLATEILEKNT